MSDNVWAGTEQGGPSDGSAVTIGDVFGLVPVLLRRGLPVLGAMVVLQLVSLVFQLLSIGATIAVQFVRDETTLLIAGGLLVVWSFVILLPSIAIGVLNAGLARPLRTAAVSPDEVGGAIPALRSAASRFFPVLGTLLLVLLITFAGICLFVLPGLAAAFLLGPAVYLTAAADEDPVSALKRSYELVMRNLGPALAMFAIQFGLVLGLVLIYIVGSVGYGAASIALAEVDPRIGPVVQSLLTPVLGLFLGVPVGYFFFVLQNSLYIAIETADAGVQIARE